MVVLVAGMSMMGSSLAPPVSLSLRSFLRSEPGQPTLEGALTAGEFSREAADEVAQWDAWGNRALAAFRSVSGLLKSDTEEVQTHICPIKSDGTVRAATATLLPTLQTRIAELASLH